MTLKNVLWRRRKVGEKAKKNLSKVNLNLIGDGKKGSPDHDASEERDQVNFFPFLLFINFRNKLERLSLASLLLEPTLEWSIWKVPFGPGKPLTA